MGLGKTVMAIMAIKERNKYPVLIVCPAPLKLMWCREIQEWLGINVKPDVINGDIIVTNYHRMGRIIPLMNRLSIKLVIFDESHILKNEKSRRTKQAIHIANRVPNRILMTGTPLLNRPHELLSQLKILDKLDKFGGEQQFLNDFCRPTQTPWGINYDGFGDIQKLKTKMDKIWIRRTKLDVIQELPKKSIIKIPIIKFKQDKFTSFKQNEAMEKDCIKHKLPMAIRWIDNFIESNEKLVIFAHHRFLIKYLMSCYPTACCVRGGQSSAIRSDNINRFQHGNANIIICSLQASSVGLTLTASSNAMFLEFPWSPSLLEQAEDRIHRMTQTKPCSIYYLYAKDSVDEQRLNLISTKKTIIDFIMR